MSTNIDQLQTEVEEIKKRLEDLKNNVTILEADKKNEAETLKSQAEAAKQKIQAEIDTLNVQAGADLDREKAKAQSLLNTLNEITTLYTSIVDAPATPASAPTQQATDNRNVFSKAKDWV